MYYIEKDKTKSRPKTAFLPVALFKTLIRIPRLHYHPIYLEVVDRVRDTFNMTLEMLTHLLSLWQEYTTLCFGKLVFFFIFTQKLFFGLKHRRVPSIMAFRSILIANSHAVITDLLDNAVADFTIYTCGIFLPCGNHTLGQGNR